MHDLERQFMAALTRNVPGLVEALRNEAHGQIDTDQPSRCDGLLIAAADALTALSNAISETGKGGETMDGERETEQRQEGETGGEAEEKPEGETEGEAEGGADTQTND